jgi:ABC-type transporter Mla maintaining outer membrane lipid asymmetry ATPase subunit MlaF
MLYEGTIRQVDKVDVMRDSKDPVVRQFLDGTPDPISTEETSMVPFNQL